MPHTWRPFTLAWNDAPIDLSFLYEKEKPGGWQWSRRSLPISMGRNA